MEANDLRFEAWLTRETGMEASSLGINTLARAVRERAGKVQRGGTPVTGVPADVDDHAIEAYWNLLNASQDERQALIETLVVPETWFFRDGEAFAALVRLANVRLAREPGRVLRILSAPCSTGEEPYSISMALFDAGIGPGCFCIDAIDISARAIGLARRAVYGRNAFRSAALAFRDRHFSEGPEGWLLGERVREPVRFVQASLFDLPFEAGVRYDFIFCRNVLIYFDRDAQDRAVRLLDAQLADGGTIFVGPAETGLMMRHSMAPARIPLAFAFHRAPAAPADDVVARRAAAPDGALAGRKAPLAKPVRPWPTRRAAADAPAPAVQAPTARARPPGRAAGAARVAQAPSSASLDEARRLADIGHFDEAERIARPHALEHGPNPDAFYLLGLIADARGLGADARDFYRKALYLDPGHYEALTHLAVLLDTAGDTQGAAHLMNRARRALAQCGTGARDNGADTHGRRM